MSTLAEQVEGGRPALWFGLLGGASAWTVHLLLAYAVAEFGCVSGFGERIYLGISIVAWLEVAATVLTTVIAALAAIVAHRSYRILRSQNLEEAGIAAGEYTARAGFITSGIFTFIILFESIPILYYLRTC
jgi:hypothetical protein